MVMFFRMDHKIALLALVAWALALGPPGSEGQVAGRTMTISAIFDDDGDKFLELAFKHAVDTVNRNR